MSTELVRDLKLRHALAVVVGTIIGSGIFLVPSEMMRAAGSTKLVYLAWIVGGLLSFFGTLTYAELGAMKPLVGGEYVYIRDAYGSLPGFLYAWSSFMIAKPASIATLTVGMVRILGTFPALQFFAHPIFTAPFVLTYGQCGAIAVTILITWLNYLSVRGAGEFQVIFTFIKVSIILGVVGVGLSSSAGSWSHFSATYTGTRGGMAGFMAALVAALWAYDGWSDLAMLSGEVRRPERNLPLALIAGVTIVGLLYIFTNIAVQYLMTPAAIASSQRPVSDAVGLVLGWRGAWFVSAGMVLSILVAVNGSILTGARVPFAVAHDRYFFSALGKVHPRFHTPSIALFVQAAMTTGLLLLGRSYERYFTITIFAEWLFYMLAASTVFIFRHREPRASRPYRVWGYPVVPALFVLAAGVLLYYTFVDNLHDSALGTLAILSGIPVFYIFARKRTA